MASMMDATHCFYVPGAHFIIDVARPDGLSWCQRRTLEEIRAEYPGAELLSWDVAGPAMEAAQRAKYVHGPKRTDAASWEEMLNVLPPRDWVREGGAESFKMCEMTTGNITSIFCRIGPDYFVLSDDVRTPHAEIVRRCKALPPV